MASELVINVTYSETRIAFLENGVLVEFFIEKKNDHSMVGSIYKGKVVRIVPGMDAAFIDIGLEKSAFLYVGDIILDRMMYEEFDGADFHFEAGERIEGVLEDASRKTPRSHARYGPYRCVPKDRRRRGTQTPCHGVERYMPQGVRAHKQDRFGRQEFGGA